MSESRRKTAMLRVGPGWAALAAILLAAPGAPEEAEYNAWLNEQRKQAEAWARDRRVQEARAVLDQAETPPNPSRGKASGKQAATSRKQEAPEE